MAKRTTTKHRAALGADPLDALVPGNAQAAIRASNRKLETAGTTPTPGKPVPVVKERLTVHVSVDLIDRVKNCVYWTPGLTLAGMAEKALADAVAKMEKKAGKPFPKRKHELRGGRPMK